MTAVAEKITKPGIYPGVPDEVRRVPVGERTALVDAGDLALVAGHRWHALAGHNGKVYAYARVPGGTVYMHRLIAGTAPGMETDHRNGDGLDNRRANLRAATQSQNSANTGKPKRRDGRPATSRFKGVSWDRGRGMWHAKITVAQRCRNLGRFHSEEEAARAYDVAALAAWGDFAHLNVSTTQGDPS